MPLTLNGTTGIAGVDGSAGTPATKGSDTDTGIVYGTNTVQIATNGTTAVTVDASQTVGIGTASPSSYNGLLNVKSSNRATIGYFGGTTYAVRFGANSSFASIEGVDAATGVSSYQPLSINGSILSLQSGGTESARIDAAGNFLIGTTSATSPVTIYKTPTNTNAGVLLVSSSLSGDSSYCGLSVQKYDGVTTTSNIFIRFIVANGSTGNGQINANGASQAAFGSFSDLRLKENIQPLSGQLSKILSLKPSEFDYRDGSGHQIGFIAQEMQKVYPDVVGEADDGMLTITGWSKTEARLVSAIQELSAKLDAAEARLAALEAK